MQCMPCKTPLPALPPELRKNVFDHLTRLEKAARKELKLMEKAISIQTIMEPLERARADDAQGGAVKEVMEAYKTRVRDYRRALRDFKAEFSEDKMHSVRHWSRNDDAVQQSEAGPDPPLTMRSDKYERLRETQEGLRQKTFDLNQLVAGWRTVAAQFRSALIDPTPMDDIDALIDNIDTEQATVPPHVTQSEGYLDLPPEMRARVYDELLKLKNVSQQELDVLKQGLLDAYQQHGERSFRAMNAGNYMTERHQIQADFESKCDEHKESYENFLSDFADDKMDLMRDLAKRKVQPSEAFFELPNDLQGMIAKDAPNKLEALQEMSAGATMTVSESAGFTDLTDDLQNLVLERLDDQRIAAWQEIQAIDAEMEQLQRKNRELDVMLDLDEERDPDALLQQKSSVDLRLIDLEREYEQKSAAYARDFSPAKLEALQDMMKKDAGKIEQSSGANLECPTCAHAAPVGRDLIDERVQQSEGFMDLPPDIRRRLYSEAGAMRTQEREDAERKIKRCVDALWRYGNVIFEYRFYFPHMKAERRMVQRKQTELYRDVQRAIQRYEATYNRRYPEELTFPEDIEDIQPSAAFVVEESKSWLPAFVTYNRTGPDHDQPNKNMDRLNYRAGLAEVALLYNLAKQMLLQAAKVKDEQETKMAEKDLQTCKQLLHQQMLHMFLEILMPQKIDNVVGTGRNVSKVHIQYNDSDYIQGEDDELLEIQNAIQDRKDTKSGDIIVTMPMKNIDMILPDGLLKNQNFAFFWKNNGKVEKEFRSILQAAIEEDNKDSNHLSTFRALKQICYTLNTALCLRIKSSLDHEQKLRSDRNPSQKGDQGHGWIIMEMANILYNVVVERMPREWKNVRKTTAASGMKSTVALLTQKCCVLWNSYSKNHYGKRITDPIHQTKVPIDKHFYFAETGVVYAISNDKEELVQVGDLNLVRSIDLLDTTLQQNLGKIPLSVGEAGTFGAYRDDNLLNPREVDTLNDFKAAMAGKIVEINQLLANSDFFEAAFKCMYQEHSMSMLSQKKLDHQPLSFVYLVSAFDTKSYAEANVQEEEAEKERLRKKREKESRASTKKS